MNLLRELDEANGARIGEKMHEFVRTLYPICRSITGDGIQHTLALIKERIPLQMSQVLSGTPVFDWTVPKEWNIRNAYINGPDGMRVLDFGDSNLHVLNYSTAVHRKMFLDELKPHLFTIPEHPDWIPYKTSYYQENWGFCLSHNQFSALTEGQYEVCIDSTLENGHLAYGELYLPGALPDEVLISAHACHPSLANDNLSGLAVSTFLAQFLAQRSLRYSYRFLFIPGTIGAITWLARNREAAQRIRHGLVLTCVGDSGHFHYKKSRQGSAEIDRAAAHVLRHWTEPSEILEFSPYGYDERQYCSPGFNLPVGCLMRSVWGSFPEYHTSADNLSFVRPEKLADSLRLCTAIIDVLENNLRYCNLNPFCEPQLGRRNLYQSVGGTAADDDINARLWVLNLSDGKHSLLDIAERSAISFPMIREAAELLHENHLLAPMQSESNGPPEREEIA